MFKFWLRCKGLNVKVVFFEMYVLIIIEFWLRCKVFNVKVVLYKESILI